MSLSISDLSVIRPVNTGVYTSHNNYAMSNNKLCCGIILCFCVKITKVILYYCY